MISFQTLWLYAKLIFFQPQYRNFKVYFIGHSFSGVHASLAALQIQIPNSWRVVAGSDAVPQYPPCKKMNDKHSKLYKKFLRKKPLSSPCNPQDRNGYYHNSNEIWYPMRTNHLYTMCTGIPKNKDFNCSDGLIYNKRNLATNLREHTL